MSNLFLSNAPFKDLEKKPQPVEGQGHGYIIRKGNLLGNETYYQFLRLSEPTLTP